MSSTINPTPEQEQRAKWDLLLLDLELRAEQVRQLKRYEPWKALAALVTAGTAFGSAVAAGILWAAHLIK
jgi:hypothetical protein